MTYHNENLAALIGSRICHDLISPIGAVNNGLELLALSGAPDGPEMSLVSDSAASANARIRLFRLAFGVASSDQTTRADEITSIWNGVHSEGRFKLEWMASNQLPRREARLVVLACLCAEVALPMGGTIRVEQTDQTWQVVATGPKFNLDTDVWDRLTQMHSKGHVQPAHVQFLLLPHYLYEMGRLCSYEVGQDTLKISF